MFFKVKGLYIYEVQVCLPVPGYLFVVLAWVYAMTYYVISWPK